MTAAMIEQQTLTLSGSFSLPSGQTFISGLIPNGVAIATLYFQAASPITLRAVNNVIVLTGPRAKAISSNSGGETKEVWRAANGTIIKTINVS